MIFHHKVTLPLLNHLWIRLLEILYKHFKNKYRSVSVRAHYALYNFPVNDIYITAKHLL